MSLSDKECNIIINKVDLNKYQTIGDLEIRGKESLEWKKGFFKENVKEFIKKVEDDILKNFAFVNEETEDLAIEALHELAGEDLK